MSRSDHDLLDTVLARLYRLRQACGSRVFQSAADRALVAIARAALEEAERRATSRNKPAATILRFPTERRRRNNDGE